MAEPESLKEEGNKYFRSGQYEDALRCYTQALELGSLNDSEKAIIFKNRSACRLKLNDHEAAVSDASACLELAPNDPKALFRRCQALDALGRVEEAYRDAVTLLKIDPKNNAVQTIFNRLNPLVQERLQKQNSLTNKVSQMVSLAFDLSVSKDKRLQALNNLIVLAREDAGAELICHKGCINQLAALVREKDADFIIAATRILASLAKTSKQRAATVVNTLDLNLLLLVLGQASAEVGRSITHLLQTILNVYVGLEEYQAALKHYEQERKKGERLRYPQLSLNEEQQRYVDQLMNHLVRMIDSGKVTAEGRDFAMELLMKNITMKKGVGWTLKFLDTTGIEGLLTVAGTQKQFKSLAVTDHSRMHASVILSTVYEDLIADKHREKFKEKCTNFLKELFGDEIIESKIEAIEVISSLLQGPYEVGNMLLGIEGVVQIMFTLANSDNIHYQRVAVEAIVNSASKKNQCSGVLKDAVPILKKLYQSADESIKVRALVGLCKLGSYSGGDVSEQPFADGSTLKLARICRKFLVNTSKDCDLRRWATEGLAYLTLDADVKEELVDDAAALNSIFDLAKNPDYKMTYACITTLVNLTNSYDKQEIIPEMVELARFAKQHVPEEHPKDKHEFVVQRIHKLAQAGVTNALVCLSGTESCNSRELICRVFLALATEQSLRGLMVQQGAVKVLLQLLENNTDTGAVLAAHSLAKIAVTMDPNTAFPGQRVYEVVRPLISLLHHDRSGLQNFEALLALTNLSSVSENIRNCILENNGLQSIEQLMFEEHEMIRRAATECMSNMVMSPKVQELFERDNDRVKVLVLFAGEEDLELMQAAAGALANMSTNHKLCHKITQVKPWLQILQALLVSDKVEIQHRASYMTLNLMAADKDIATRLIESRVLEILMALTRLDGEERAGVREYAQAALDKAVELELIRPYDANADAGIIFKRAPDVKQMEDIVEAAEGEQEESDNEDEKAKAQTNTDNQKAHEKITDSCPKDKDFKQRDVTNETGLLSNVGEELVEGEKISKCDGVLLSEQEEVKRDTSEQEERKCDTKEEIS